MAITLRKKAPFWCRSMIGGKPSCLAVLVDSDGNMCAACVAKSKEIADKPIRETAPPSGRFITDAEWAERVARGPIWPINTILALETVATANL